MANIFSGEFIEAMNIRNLLEIENIEVFTVNEYMSSIEPWVVSPGGFKPLILQVNDEDFEKAKIVVEDYRSGKLEVGK
ncbi:DUF2007 domain-containing protein [Flavobacterium sp. SUN046]|uniref:putative signal transducing protein n=1 Tax=Flavobacterium sp. SUN046 TaxID=3002440 RepID=UPI002DB5EB07|nr:DUF2007 domain-containing protein [Flavobacterium sp. SUN046]MEC4049645.1 DUF2007 domain-containing protein [Flavobacterium sp. SUN046]